MVRYYWKRDKAIELSFGWVGNGVSDSDKPGRIIYAYNHRDNINVPVGFVGDKEWSLQLSELAF